MSKEEILELINAGFAPELIELEFNVPLEKINKYIKQQEKEERRRKANTQKATVQKKKSQDEEKKRKELKTSKPAHPINTSNTSKKQPTNNKTHFRYIKTKL